MGLGGAPAQNLGLDEVQSSTPNGQTTRLDGRTRKEFQRKLPKHKIDEIILDNREHGKRLAWSFLSSWRVSMHPDEVVSVVGAALCEAATRFDPDKGVAFRTFFFYHLRGMLLKEIARVIQEQRVLQFIPHSSVTDVPTFEQTVTADRSLPLIENNNPEKVIERRQIAGVCWEACKALDELEREVLVRYFVYDEPLVDIAKELDYCRCHISRVKSRALAKVARFLKPKLLAHYQGDTGPEQQLPAQLSMQRLIGAARNKSYTGGRGRRKRRPKEGNASNEYPAAMLAK